MEGEEVAATRIQILLLAKVVQGIDVDEFIQKMETLETTALIMDPTGYLKFSGNMRDSLTLARGLREFKKAVNEVIRRCGTCEYCSEDGFCGHTLVGEEGLATPIHSISEQGCEHWEMKEVETNGGRTGRRPFRR